MKLTSKGRYAVTAMLDVAIYGQERPINLADISARQDISLSYLEQLFAKLRKEQLVKSVRGPGGGYKLARLAKDISVGQIIAAVNENIDATKCHGKGDCHAGSECLTHHLWQDLSERISQFLDGISIADLVRSNDHSLGAKLDSQISISVQI